MRFFFNAKLSSRASITTDSIKSISSPTGPGVFLSSSATPASVSSPSVVAGSRSAVIVRFPRAPFDDDVVDFFEDAPPAAAADDLSPRRPRLDDPSPCHASSSPSNSKPSAPPTPSSSNSSDRRSPERPRARTRVASRPASRPRHAPEPARAPATARDTPARHPRALARTFNARAPPGALETTRDSIIIRAVPTFERPPSTRRARPRDASCAPRALQLREEKNLQPPARV
mmetsp:Transcript_1412/g.5158  ORF Transcript_1412/g.5158 Transcript_1412/m.5158 type:complete len:230 (-) Transcript_1412:34-723(-)